MGRKLASTLVVLALAAALAACGGGSKPLSATAFRTRANAVCRDVTRRLDTLAGQTSSATMHAALARAADATSDALVRFEAIHPPAALAARYDAYKAWVKTRHAAAVKLAHGDTTLSAREEAAVRPHANGGSTVARELRLSDCN